MKEISCEDIPAPQLRRGGCAVNKRREATLVPRRRARSASAIVRSSNSGVDQPFFYLLTSTTPSAPDKEAPRYLFDVASTPPQLRRGVCAPTGCVKYIDALAEEGKPRPQTRYREASLLERPGWSGRRM